MHDTSPRYRDTGDGWPESYQYQESVINTRLSPSPARASYYPQLSLPPRVSIIKLDPDDAGLTRTKIEEGELGEAEVWRRGDKMTSRQREMDDGGGHWW